MILSRNTPCQAFSIFQPRWKDRTVMLANYKVGTHNSIKFTKAPTMEGEYYISGAKAKTFPLESNGTIQCYCVPLSELEPLERSN